MTDESKAVLDAVVNDLLPVLVERINRCAEQIEVLEETVNQLLYIHKATIDALLERIKALEDAAPSRLPRRVKVKEKVQAARDQSVEKRAAELYNTVGLTREHVATIDHLLGEMANADIGTLAETSGLDQDIVELVVSMPASARTAILKDK